jgi:adenylate kinase family enzyme
MTCIGRRVSVIGTTASGKSTLAAALAVRLGVPHIELDGAQHGTNWAPIPRDEFRGIVAARIAGDGWVTDGNYGVVRDLIWPRADTVIWLDYPMVVPLWRVTGRTFWRMARRVELWNGNREQWRRVFSRDNLWLYILRTHRGRRHRFAALLAQPEYAHLAVIRLRSPRAAARLLASLPARTPTDALSPRCIFAPIDERVWEAVRRTWFISDPPKDTDE